MRRRRMRRTRLTATGYRATAASRRPGPGVGEAVVASGPLAAVTAAAVTGAVLALKRAEIGR